MSAQPPSTSPSSTPPANVSSSENTTSFLSSSSSSSSSISTSSSDTPSTSSLLDDFETCMESGGCLSTTKHADNKPSVAPQPRSDETLEAFAILDAFRDQVVTYQEFQPVVQIYEEWAAAAKAHEEATGHDYEESADFAADLLPCIPDGRRARLRRLVAEPVFIFSNVPYHSLEEIMAGTVAAASGVCRIFNHATNRIGTGFRCREHQYVIVTNAHNISDHAALMAAEFTFTFPNDRSPLVVKPCADASKPDRRCWRVVLPDKNSLPDRSGVRGFHKPDLAVILFEASSANGAIFRELEADPSRLWPSLVGHFVPDVSQMPLSTEMKDSVEAEAEAARFLMPKGEQPVALTHFGCVQNNLRHDTIPLQISLFGRVVGTILTPRSKRDQFAAIVTDCYAPDGSSGGPPVRMEILSECTSRATKSLAGRMRCC